MNINHFLKVFQNSTNLLNSSELTKLEIDYSVGIYLDSVFLKLYKKEWGNNFSDPLNANTRIFFSVWVSNKTLLNDKLFYNIHAFKLRDLKGYSISSRDFASNFRSKFNAFKHEWENVSVNFGPLTLMEGWVNYNKLEIERTISNLANNFIKISDLIDETLKIFEHQSNK
jgi:hypothetical protein